MKCFMHWTPKKVKKPSKELSLNFSTLPTITFVSLDLTIYVDPGSNGERALEVRAVGRAGRTDCVKGALKLNGAKEKG